MYAHFETRRSSCELNKLIRNTAIPRKIHTVQLSCVVTFGVFLFVVFDSRWVCVIVAKAFTDTELYILSGCLFVGGNIFQLPSSGQDNTFTLSSALRLVALKTALQRAFKKEIFSSSGVLPQRMSSQRVCPWEFCSGVLYAWSKKHLPVPVEPLEKRSRRAMAVVAGPLLP